MKATILSPSDYIGAIMELCQSKRGQLEGMDYLSEDRVEMRYTLPLAEIVFDFFDQLKSRTKGYASLDYEPTGEQAADLVKVDILLQGETVDAFSAIVHRDHAYSYGVALAGKLRELIPRQQFEVPIQAAIGARVIARETIRAIRKDVLAKCYGGDITRKRKLLEKQKEGKKRMKMVGRVEVPQEAFIAALSSDAGPGGEDQGQEVTVEPVREQDWPVVARLWQAYRNDLARDARTAFRRRRALQPQRPRRRTPPTTAPGCWPGRRTRRPGTSRRWRSALARRSRGRAAVGDGLLRAYRRARRDGLGRTLARETLRRFEGPWTIAFQHDNAAAGRFWRAAAREAFGDAWREEQRPVPGLPDVPPDHWIDSLLSDLWAAAERAPGSVRGRGGGRRRAGVCSSCSTGRSRRSLPHIRGSRSKSGADPQP